MGLFRFFRSGGKVAWILIGSVLMVIAASTALLANTAEVRYERDVTRMVFNDNVGVLEDIRKSLGMEKDSVQRALAGSPEAPGVNQAYIVVTDAPFFGRTDSNGIWSASEVPHGTYRVEVWHPRLREPGELNTEFVVREGTPADLKVRLTRSLRPAPLSGHPHSWDQY